MISFIDARELVMKEAVPPGTEEIPLPSALHRVLAQNIRSDRHYPPFNRAAMDGYAIRWEEFENGRRSFQVKETIFAGAAPLQPAGMGNCYKIMTGAAVPEGMDMVVRVEDTEWSDGLVTMKDIPAKPFLNIARQGEDLQPGDIVLKAPSRCNASTLSVLAALGISRPLVYSLPRVTLITTGNEVVAHDVQPSPLQIRNSNALLLAALLEQEQIKPDAVLHLPDERSRMEPVFLESLHSDIVITCGGVSAGDADLIPGIWESIGVKKLFHKVAIKPGKPIWCGKSVEGTMIFSLPGNPLSCLLTFKLFVEPYIHACYGLPSLPFRKAMFRGKRQKRSSLDEFFPVKYTDEGNAVEPMAFRGSGDIVAALGAAAFAWHPAEEDVLDGGEVKLLPL